MTHALVLGRRALREGIRTPEAIVPTLFIPLFFLVVNVGQAAKIFPGSTTDFLHGQGYGAFQLPASLLLAASFGTAALFLVEEIEGGYFDKLRATPVHRSAIVLGRLVAEGVKRFFLIFNRQVFENFSSQFARQQSQHHRFIIRIQIYENFRDVGRRKPAKNFAQAVEITTVDHFHQFGHQEITYHAASEAEKNFPRKTKSRSAISRNGYVRLDRVDQIRSSLT